MNEIIDPTKNVTELVEASIKRLDDLREREVKRLDERIKLSEEKSQIQFTAAEKAVSAALDGTKEAINKADITTDKRFDLLSEKIDGVMGTINKSSGERGIYVTHADLSAEMEKLRSSFEAMLRPVVTFMNAQSGKGEGMQNLYGWIVSGVLLLIAIISFIIKF